MNKQILCFLLFQIFALQISFAQPPPCLPAQGGVPGGNDLPGCLMCSPIYSGNTGGYTASGLTSTPCASMHNNQYFAVVADASGTLSATVLFSNCQLGLGVDMVIIDASLNIVSNCYTSNNHIIPGVGNATASGLTPGEMYFVMIDGWASDICDFTLTVSGNAGGMRPGFPGIIRVDPDTSPLCPGAVVCYEIDSIQNANIYEWDVPGNATIISGGGTGDLEVCVQYDSPGGGVVRVSGSNACFPGIPSVSPVTVLPILPTLKPPEEICGDDLPIIRDGHIFNGIGAQNVTLKTGLGCDSIVTYIFIPLIQVPNVIDTVLCKGQSMLVGNMSYDTAGSYQITLEDPFSQANGCDSLVILSLKILDPVAVIQPPPPIDCAPGATALLDGSSSSSGAAFSYQWSSPDGGFIPPINQTTATITSSGTYILTVSQISDDSTLTCTATDTVVVIQQDPPLPPPVFTLGPDEVCFGEMHDFSVTPVANATSYQWILPNGTVLQNQGTTLNIDFNSVASGDICVVAVGDCSDSPPVCKPVTVHPIPTSDFTLPQKICITDSGQIMYSGTAGTGATYTWNFNGGTPANVTGPGPHDISWTSQGIKNVTLTVEENGCISTQTSQPIQIDAELPIPVISCSSTPTSVTFTWTTIPGVDNYSVSINGGAAVTQTTTTITESGLTAGTSVDITVTANGTTACGSSMASTSCVSQNCPVVDLNIVPVLDICRSTATTPINLSAAPTGGLGGGMFTWSGTGVSPTGIFNPSSAAPGANTIVLEYTEGTCTYTGSITVNVFDIPNADFSITSPICITQNAMVSYTGSASASATYNWDFASANINSGSAAGPYEIGFITAGTYDISLMVEENGCISQPNVQQIQVDDELPIPNIFCSNVTTTSVEFSWDEVPGATNYIINGQGVVDLNTRTVFVDGLTAGDEITIEVVAEGNSVCGSSRNSFTCKASDCPPEPIDITPIDPICQDANAMSIMLSATAGDNTGIFTWSGPGISQPNIFDPNDPSVNPGDLTIRVSYQKDNCTYDASTQIRIIGQPSADFEVTGPICAGDPTTVTYTGSAGSTANFNWDFAGGNISSGAGSGPFEIVWTNAGTPEISLIVEENNCASEPFSRQIQVDAPLQSLLINCDASQTGISFNWSPIPDALTYSVELLDGTPGVFDGVLNYEVSGLTPGDEVEIAVLVTGTTVCGPTSDTLRCTAQNCPDYNVVMPIIAPLCLSGGIAPLLLDTLISVENLLGESLFDSIRMRWHDGNDANDYLSSGGRFFPTPAADLLGAGDIPIVVEIEYPINSGCFQTFSSTIRLNALPNNSFTINPQICVTDFATVEISVPPTDPDATYDWDFGEANIISGTDAGPYELSWDVGGLTDTISLSITEFGCTASVPFRQIIKIDNELNPLAANLRCNADNTDDGRIEFIWDNVPGATNVGVTVLTPGITLTSTTLGSALFEGLSQNDSVTIEVVFRDSLSACPAVSAIAGCKAINCPPTVITIDPIVDSCLSATIPTAIQLTVQFMDDPTGGTGISTWSGGSHITTDGLFSPDAADLFPVAFAYSANGCNYTATAEITMIQTPTADFTVNPVICETDSATIQFIGNAPTGSVFNWEFDDGMLRGTDDAPEFVRWENDLGIQNLSLTLENQGCLSAPVSQQVQVDPKLDTVLIDCINQQLSTTDINFTWNSDPNVTEYEISLETPFGSGNFVSQGTQTNTDFLVAGLMPVGAGRAKIQVVARGNTICGEETDNLLCTTLTCPPVTIDFLGQDNICIDGAPFPVSYIPSGGDGTGMGTLTGTGINTLGIFNPADAGVGTHTLSVTYVENSCDYPATFEITVNDLPAVDAGADQEISCFETDAEIGSLTADPSLNYNWVLNGSNVGNEPNLNVSTGGTYELTVTDPLTNCSAIDQVFVDTSFSNPKILAQVSQITCFGRNDGTIEIQGMQGGDEPYEYSMNGGDFSSKNEFTNLGQGTYEIRGRDANGCEDQITFTILEPDELTVEIIITAGENPVPFGDSAQLTAVTNYAPDLLANIEWSPVDQLPTCDETNITNCLTAWVSPTGQTIYSVRVENLNGCAAGDETRLDVLKTHPVYIPSGFSPRNSDGINDYFQVFGNSQFIQEVKTFMVFDRWGEPVFKQENFQPSTTSDPDNGWDGRYRGKMLNSGVYVFFAEVEFKDGVVEIFKGDITLK